MKSLKKLVSTVIVLALVSTSFSFQSLGLSGITTAFAAFPTFNSQTDAVIAPTGFGVGQVWKVGPTEQYKKPSDVVALVKDGDTVEIDAATYKCDTSVKWNKNFLTLRGVGGRPLLDATGCSISGDKGIWNPMYNMSNMIVDNIEFIGASGASNNDAGIRYDGGGYLYITNSYFHDNQNGVLITPGTPADIVIDHSEFARNGFGDGYTHNMYISGNASSFVLRFSYSHDAIIGHTVKSRALKNYIIYNRLADEANGTSSYNIDIPQGGLTYIIGNIIQQGTKSPNYGIISYSAEGTHNPLQAVYIANNTFVNEILNSGTVVNLYNNGLTEAKMVNNLVVGITQANLIGVSPTKITLTNNLLTNSPAFFDQKNRNYKLTATSPAVNTAVDSGMGGSVSLAPLYEFVYPTSSKVRTVVGAKWDIGAYEYNPTESVTPAPTVSLNLQNSTISNNTAATLSWSSTNSTSCQAFGAWTGIRPTSGNYTSELLLANKTFSITCTGGGGSAQAQVTVTVNDSAQATALGTYTWSSVSNSQFNTVCAANIKDSAGNLVYKNNFGTGPMCESKWGLATGVYVPGTGRWYLIGGGSGRSYYGNEVYAFNFATMKPEMVTKPTLISDTKEYFPDDLYNSKIHMNGCNGTLHLKAGGIAPAPRALDGGVAFNPTTNQIVVWPTGFVAGIGNCKGSNEGQVATDIWSFNPFANTWSLLAPENDKFGSVSNATWFLDPATGIAYDSGNRNGLTRGGYLIDYKNPSPTPAVALVDNVWPFGGVSEGSNVIDTTNHYSFQITNSLTMSVFNLNGLSMNKYGTNGAVGTTGTAGGKGPLYEPVNSWKFTGDTGLLDIPNFAVTYNAKIQKFVAWAGDDRVFFLTPNYQTKVLDILTKHITGNPTSTVGVRNKFTYIPDRDLYIAFVGTDKNIYFLTPPKSTVAVPPVTTPPVTTTPPIRVPNTPPVTVPPVVTPPIVTVPPVVIPPTTTVPPTVVPPTPPSAPPITNSPTPGTSTSWMKQVLLIKGEQSEVASVWTAAAVTPTINTKNITGTLGIKGKWVVNFVPAETGNGVLFGKGGQQNSDTAYYEFKWQNIGSLFGSDNIEIAFTLKSTYAFKDRQLLSRYNDRYTFDVLDANGSVTNFTSETMGDRLIFYFKLWGVNQYYYVPVGQEETIFGKDKLLKVRLVTNGTSHTLYLNNINVWNSTYANTVPNWTSNSLFVLGAAGNISYGSGYFSSDDAIDEFSVSTP